MDAPGAHRASRAMQRSVSTIRAISRLCSAAGAELVSFDTLHSTSLPPVDGLFIGGGFPETQMDALSANRGCAANCTRRSKPGLPAYAECGGLMYLARSIEWNGRSAADGRRDPRGYRHA